MAVEDIRIPDIGDAEDVEVVELCVAVGTEVHEDDALIVIESDKASMEVPSPVAGRIVRLDVDIGDKVVEGQVIAGVEVTGKTAEPARAAPAQGTPAKGAPAKGTPAKGAPAKGAPAKDARTGEAPSAKQPTVEVAVERSEPVAAKRTPPGGSSRAGRGRIEVRLPDVGDAEGVVVAEVGTKVGATVEIDDLLMVVESDKASMEIPAPAAGLVLEVAVAPGEEIAEGALLVVIETTEAVGVGDAPTAQTAVETAAPEAKAAERVQRAPTTVSEPQPQPAPAKRVYAGPAVRRLARELGVDLERVEGSGARGRIVKDDVQAFVKKSLTQASAAPGVGIPRVPTVEFAKFGPVESVELSRIRRRGADNLHRSWLNVPHVTQHDEADVTELEAFRASLKAEAAEQGVKLTPLPLLMAAVGKALVQFPLINASLDEGIGHLIVKHYVHLGFAVDTPDGLIVPVVKDADKKGIFALALEIESLTDKARRGKLSPADLAGGTFTISSLGNIGGTAFTPIVNAPEIAILGVSRLATRPHWDGSAFVPRQFLPLSLSYDHRAINGAEAGRFMTALCRLLTDVRRVLL